jgi:hypothetical protein
MSISADLQTKLKHNQHTIYITDSDDLLAAWQFQRNSSSKRSKNLCMVPTEWRYSVPPHEKSPLLPCHISYKRKAAQSFSVIKPAFEYSTKSCHHTHGASATISVPNLDALDAVTFAKRNVAPYVSPILDTATLSLVCKDLGIAGRAIPKVINGRQYIAFSGYAGLRRFFPGTIYSANNRKIIKMAIGTLGIKNMVRNGGIITFCITVPLTILEAFLKDHSSCYELVGNLATDLLKIGIPALMGYLFGLAAGTATTIASLPAAIVIVVSVSTGIALDYLDDHFKLSDKLAAALEDLGQKLDEKYNQLQKAVDRAPHAIERAIVWRSLWMDIDNPIGR